jgi:hypothetical protein
MTKRTPAENRLLLDATQVAIAVGVLVALTQTWWVVFDEDGGDDHLRSGWSGLGTSTFAEGWVVIIGVVVALVAVGLGIRAAHGVAAVVAGIASIFMLLSLVNVENYDGYDFTSSVWVGLVLLAATTLTQIFWFASE